DFRSPNQAEVHAIGFDQSTNAGADMKSAQPLGFQLYGKDSWGRKDFRDYAATAPQWKHYRIPVGEFYTGSFNYLFFANDHDVSKPTGEGYFANIKVYEQGTVATTWEVNSLLLGGTTAMGAEVTTSPTVASLVSSPLDQVEPAVM